MERSANKQTGNMLHSSGSEEATAANGPLKAPDEDKEDKQEATVLPSGSKRDAVMLRQFDQNWKALSQYGKNEK